MPWGQSVGLAAAAALADVVGSAALADTDAGALGAATAGSLFGSAEALGFARCPSGSQEASVTSRHQGASRTALAYSTIRGESPWLQDASVGWQARLFVEILV